MRVFALLASVLILAGAASAPVQTSAQTPAQTPARTPAQAAPPPGQSDDVVIDVNAGNIKPLPIAIAPFAGAARGSDIAQVISANLERSGLFDPIDPATFPESGLGAEKVPRYSAWQAVNAQYLVSGSVVAAPDGRLQVNFFLYDTSGQRSLIGRTFTASPENWRRIAHKISDLVYEKLTGEKGYFDTRIVFVAESGGRLNRIKRLAIMDQDGANPSYLTDGSYIVMSPRFSTNSQTITYMALRPTGSSVYVFDIETGRQETIGRFPGMVFAPRFSPDGQRVAFSAEKGGNSDIWVMDLRTRSPARLTTDPGIDTSPSFSPNGSQIAFNSDRGGSPQIYVMNGDGSGVRRISFGSGRYTTPVWSPDGQFIAFTKQEGGVFHIGIMRPDGSDERILTTSYLDEGPTWAPNGRVIMFSRATSGGAPRLWTVDVTGRIVRPAPYESSGSDPAWSPLLD